MRSLLLTCSLIASLWLPACGGCGDDSKVGQLPDAPPRPDAPIDVMMEGNPVTLTVLKAGAPAPGVKVYFLNADNSVVLTDVTDVNGVARAEMMAGGSVTAVNPFTTPLVPAGAAPPDELRTFVGVKPGDHLALVRIATSTFTLTAPIAPGGLVETGYAVLTTCGNGSLALGTGSGAPLSGDVAVASCGNDQADIAVVATTPPQAEVPPSGSTFEILFKPDQTLPDLTANNPTLNLTGSYDDPAATVAFSYTNAPDTSIAAQHWLIRDRGNLGPFFVEFSDNTTGTSTVPAAAPLSPAIVDTTLAASGGGVGVHDVIDWGAVGATYTRDLDGVLLRDLLSQPSFDAATSRVSWTEATTGAVPDLTSTAILVNRSGQRWHWEIVAPYKSGEISFPHLPVETIDYNPGTDDDVSAEAVVNAKVPGGYDVARAQFLNLRDPALITPSLIPPDVTGFVNGSSGTAVMVQTELPPLIEATCARLRRAGARRGAAAAAACRAR
jgi:hypothetical protein